MTVARFYETGARPRERRRWFAGLATGERSQHCRAIGIVALIHLAVIWVLTAGMRSDLEHTAARGFGELDIRVLRPDLGPRGPSAPSLDRSCLSPEEVIVPEPQITIESDRDMAYGIAAVGATRKLPPRLDPRHLNEKPELPHTIGMVGALDLELRILVLPDGSVGDAQVIRSTGDAGIDRLAIETVKNSWHYLPASINGKPIEAWATVIVRFAAI